MKKKKIAVLLVLAVLALGNAVSTHALSQVNTAFYSGEVAKTSDMTTGSLMKTTTGDGTNRVSSIPSGASLCSWINNNIGIRVTDKADYSTTGKYSMKYTTDIDLSNPGPHLSTTMVVSTRWFEFDSAYTSGTWSPDPF